MKARQMGPLSGKDLNVETAGITDAGMIRENNEDRILVIDKKKRNAFGSKTFGIYLIADGMGGHPGGEVASETAKSSISARLLGGLKATSAARSPSQLVEQAIQKAHDDILQIAGSRSKLRSMGTTVTVGLRLDYELYLGHVGDSRAYLKRGDEIRQLTEDHSMVALLMKQGLVAPADARTHPDKGKILRSLGVTRDITVDTGIRWGAGDRLTLCRGDSLVFCSDGLTEYVSDEEISGCLKRGFAPKEACKKLIQMANSRGGGDNTSVIVIRLG